MWHKRLALETLIVFVLTGGFIYGITGEIKTLIIVAVICAFVYLLTWMRLRERQ